MEKNNYVVAEKLLFANSSMTKWNQLESYSNERFICSLKLEKQNSYHLQIFSVFLPFKFSDLFQVQHPPVEPVNDEECLSRSEKNK